MSIHHEPTDEPTPRLIPVSADTFEALAHTLGAVVELGEPDVVRFNQALYRVRPVQHPASNSEGRKRAAESGGAE